jgi:hypothetical protein
MAQRPGRQSLAATETNLMPDMPDMNEARLAALAREMAMRVRDAAAIFADYGIDETQYYELSTRHEFFKRAMEQFALEWNSTLSTADRVRVLSAAALEDALPMLGARMKSMEPLASVAEVAKLMARNAGIGAEAKGDAKSNERFVITINLGDKQETYNKSIEVKPNDVDLGASDTANAVTVDLGAAEAIPAPVLPRPKWKGGKKGKVRIYSRGVGKA